MSNYLTEFSIIHIALVLGYWFFLRKERQYAKMRFYLLASTLLALIIPLIKLPKLLFQSNDPIHTMPLETIQLDAMTVTTKADASIWNPDLLIWIYVTISVFFLIKFLNSLFYLIYLERRSSCEKFNDLYVLKVANIKGSFTFFNWIFLSDEIDKSQEDYEVILKHEKAHASLGHTYDLMFFELFKVCFWWLPTTWFINKEIRKIHEYQADACALKSYGIDQYSSILISSTLRTNGLSLASSFHDGLILKRLIAMKQQAKNVSPWKLGTLGALGVILFVVFACSEEQDGKTKDIFSQSNADEYKMDGEVYTVVEELPQYPGGLDALYDYVASEIKYPEEARTGGIEGRVYVQFVVEKDGSLSDVKVIKGIDADCDSEATRVVQNASKFKPGSQRGKAVRVRMTLPIVFKLNEGKSNADNSAQGIIVVEEVQLKKDRLKVDAQYSDGQWSGTVYDDEGKELPGANIVVTGTTTGTVSDLDGTFKVKADGPNDLHISFVGYENVRLEVK
ncbi:TonB family protein [Fulvivirga sp. M361]|uniref:TonB family protein n=1 Tax=Fulvivirga sp. M361 TaxID=2594266 RepID=UPI00117B5EE5|nr:TonB family protein [Fulvivirga sp. M361]TRX59459.1 TonB family protein [Fulvivirga sp. M361]